MPPKHASAIAIRLACRPPEMSVGSGPRSYENSEAAPTLCGAAWSTLVVHFSGEPFCGRDIQFQHPQIGVESPPARDESRDFLGFCHLLRELAGRFLPFIGAVRLQDALEDMLP